MITLTPIARPTSPTSTLAVNTLLADIKSPPYVPQCTSWSEFRFGEESFRSFVPSSLREVAEKTDHLAHLALAWSSHCDTPTNAAKLIGNERSLDGFSVPEVKKHFDDVLTDGTEYFYRNALVRYHILGQIASVNWRDPHYEDYQGLLNYRKMISHMGTKIDYIKLNVPDTAVSNPFDSHPTVSRLLIDIGVLERNLRAGNREVCFELKDKSLGVAIPFGINTHPIMLMFIKNKDGQFDLRIFNKGYQPKVNPFIEQNWVVHDGGKPYLRNDILIKGIDPYFLFHPTLMRELIEHRCTSDGNLDQAYEAIHRYVVVRGKGTVVITDEEKRYTDLYSRVGLAPKRSARARRLKKSLKKAEERMIQSSPFHHRLMAIGACFEANASTPEKVIASQEVLDRVHSYSLQVLIDSLELKGDLSSRHSSCVALAQKKLSILSRSAI